jgi:hypothetical protein
MQKFLFNLKEAETLYLRLLQKSIEAEEKNLKLAEKSLEVEQWKRKNFITTVFRQYHLPDNAKISPEGAVFLDEVPPEEVPPKEVPPKEEPQKIEEVLDDAKHSR